MAIHNMQRGTGNKEVAMLVRQHNAGILNIYYNKTSHNKANKST